MKDFIPETNKGKKRFRIPMTSSNDAVNFNDSIEARRFIRGWCEKFKRATGKAVDYCDTNAGRIEFDRMTDDEALFVAKDLHRMDTEGTKRWKS